MSSDRPMAGERGDEDGADPKRFFDRRTWDEVPRKHGRKALQLCGQVHEAVAAALAGAADDALLGLTVVSVEPAPHSGRLRVTVAVGPTADATDRTTAADALARAAGYLRGAVAAAVHRRKVPELVFTIERS